MVLRNRDALKQAGMARRASGWGDQYVASLWRCCRAACAVQARPALPPWPPTSPPPCFAAAEPDASVQVVASVAVSAACGLPQQGNSRIIEAGLPSLREHDDSPREADCHHHHHHLHHHRHHMSVDPLALMNALPSALQRSTTMPAADDSWVPAMPSVELEPAALRR